MDLVDRQGVFLLDDEILKWAGLTNLFHCLGYWVNPDPNLKIYWIGFFYMGWTGVYFLKN